MLMPRTAFSTSRVLGAGEELLSIELLEEHARRLAALLSIAPERGSGHAHLRRLKGHIRALRGVYTALADDARVEATSPAAGQWSRASATTGRARSCSAGRLHDAG